MRTQYFTFMAILIVSISLQLLPTPQSYGVLPPPDGGYPGGNTAEGRSALLNLTTGEFNTGLGFSALKSNTGSSFNTAIGAGALFANTAFNNTATGAGALLSNTTGEANTASGAFALLSNTEGLFNTAVGAFSLRTNTTGVQNTAIGNSALVSNTEGNFNTAVGDTALFENTTGDQNTAIGEAALGNNTDGMSNTGVGDHALAANTTGDSNTALGGNALSSNHGGNKNVALGSGAGSLVTTASNVICIGTNVGGANVDNSCFIGNIRNAIVAPDAAPVLVDSSGKLGTTTGSSRRLKSGIKPMESASETILSLKPVTFHYKGDNTNALQFGLIAEQVADVNPDLVVRDNSGELVTVRYDAVNAMLLNEFLKEHRKVQDLQATVAHQQNQIQALITSLQKVNARVDAIPVPQWVATNP
jgi:hypothetical protein